MELYQRLEVLGRNQDPPSRWLRVANFLTLTTERGFGIGKVLLLRSEYLESWDSFYFEQSGESGLRYRDPPENGQADLESARERQIQQNS